MPDASRLQPRLRLLGRFELSLGDQLAPAAPYEKVRALLAWLALHPSPHARDALADLLWPATPGEQARTNLRRALFDLRRCVGALPGLPEDWLLADRKRVGLNPAHPWQVDVLQFETDPLPSTAYATDSTPASATGPAPSATTLHTWQTRLALYQGPLLHDLDLPDTPALEQWLAARRSALQQRAVQLALQLAQWQAQAGALDAAQALARQALAWEPWHEGAQRLLLGWLGQHSPAAALAQFTHYRHSLQQELGLQPEAATLALGEALRQQLAVAEPTTALAHAQATASATAPTQAPTTAPATPERRRVLVLVADLQMADLSPLGPGDPELAAQPGRQLLAAATALLSPGPGLLRKAEQGELLVYFGHPQAHEHSARHALQAALALQQLVARHSGWRLGLGLHAGWTYIDPADPQPDASGELARQARRLAVSAPAGQLWLSTAMAQLCERQVQLQAMVGGAWRWLGWASPHPNGHLNGHATPLVGRSAELGQLQHAWRQACQGQFAALLLEGEPGLGKSRLLQELLQRSGTQACAAHTPAGPWHLSLACQPAYSHSPFHPLLQALHPLLQLPTDASAPQRRDAADLLLTRLGLAHLPEHRDSLWRLLGLLPSQQPPAPAERKRQDETLLLTLLTRLGAGQPGLLLVEDLHWADPSTLELLARLLRQRPAGTLLLCSSRPGGPAQAAPLAGLLPPALPLRPLASAEMAQLVQQLGGLDEAQVRAVVRRADGVPLFAEELTRTLRDASRLPSPTPPTTVPTTLWDLLAARLDQLGPTKRLAQLAAVVGRDFDLALLRAAYDGPAAALASGLQQLVDAGLILPLHTHGSRFRHALIRDVAYLSLSLAERRQLHARLAQALAGPCAERVAELPELLAQHLSEAGDPNAATYWLAAGQRGMAQSALQEASHHLHAGLAALAPLPDTHPLRRRLELPLQHQLGTVLLATQGYGSVAAKTSFRRLLQLCDQGQGRPDSRFHALWGLWLGGRTHDDDAPPLAVARALLQEAQHSADPVALAQAHYALGNNHLFLGELDAAAQQLQASQDHARPLNPARLIARAGEDSGLCAQAMASWAQCLQGNATQALATSADNQRRAAQLGHPHTQAYVLTFAAVLQRHLRQPGPATELSQAVLALAQEHGLALWQAAGATVLGWAQACQGNPDGLLPLRQGVAGAAVAMPAIESTIVSFLADALLQLGQPADALAQANQGLATGRLHHEHYLRPEFLRLRALAWAAQQAPGAPTDPRVAATLAEAAHSAQALGAHWLALRIASDQARLRTLPPAQAATRLRQTLAAVQGPAHLPDIAQAQHWLAE